MNSLTLNITLVAKLVIMIEKSVIHIRLNYF